MQKVIFIAEEFFRSFRKSLFKNILLMFMFSAGFVMAALMESYYLEMGQYYSETSYYTEGGIWCDITIRNDEEEFADSFITADGCINMLEYYDALTHMEKNPVYSAQTHQGISVREDDFEKMFHGNSYDGFLHENHSSAFMAYADFSGNGNQVESLLELKSAQLDIRAYQIFALRTEEGEGFTEDNTTIKTAADPVPVVLGNDYKGIVRPGQRLDIMISGTGYVYPCKVAGILEKGMQIPYMGDATQDMVTLDSYFLFPFGIQVSDKRAEAGMAERYAYLDMRSLVNAAVRMKNEDEFIPLANRFQKTGQEFGLPPVQLVGGSLGLNLLRRESEEEMRVILILTLVLVFFTFYGLFVTFYDKVQANKRTYGIYLMNGCSVWMVMVSYLMETAVILVPAVCACRYVFLDKSMERMGLEADSEMILRVVNWFAIASFLAGAVFIAIIMKGVNVEKLVRQKD